MKKNKKNSDAAADELTDAELNSHLKDKLHPTSKKQQIKNLQSELSMLNGAVGIQNFVMKKQDERIQKDDITISLLLGVICFITTVFFFIFTN